MQVNQLKTWKAINRGNAGYFSIFSMIIGVGFIVSAMFSYSNFNIIENMVSHLGIGPGISALLFAVGMICSGIIAIPFFWFLGESLKKVGGKMERTRRIAQRSSIIACVSLTLTGCFPMYPNLIVFHAVFALSFFMFGLVFCISYSYIMWNDDVYARWQAVHGFFVASTFGLFLSTFQPIFEWIVFFSIVSWVLQVGIYINVKKVGLSSV